MSGCDAYYGDNIVLDFLGEWCEAEEGYHVDLDGMSVADASGGRLCAYRGDQEANRESLLRACHVSMFFGGVYCSRPQCSMLKVQSCPKWWWLRLLQSIEADKRQVMNGRASVPSLSKLASTRIVTVTCDIHYQDG